MDSSIVVNQQQHFKIAPTDDSGAARSVGTPVWSLTSGDGVLTADADGLGATLVPSDTPTVDVVDVKANPDLTGVGTNLLDDTANVTTTAVPIPLATKLNLSADAPTPKP